MPRSPSVSRETILAAALNLTRQGKTPLSARALAAELACSTQPIFSHFSSMKELEEAMLQAAFARYTQFLQASIAENRYPPYKASGMGYIRFAREEPQLFRLLYMTPREERPRETEEAWDPSIRILQEKLGLDEASANLFHAEMWVVVHGIATMAATGYRDWGEDTASAMLTDHYFGLIARYGGQLHVRD